VPTPDPEDSEELALVPAVGSGIGGHASRRLLILQRGVQAGCQNLMRAVGEAHTSASGAHLRHVTARSSMPHVFEERLEECREVIAACAQQLEQVFVQYSAAGDVDQFEGFVFRLERHSLSAIFPEPR